MKSLNKVRQWQHQNSFNCKHVWKTVSMSLSLPPNFDSTTKPIQANSLISIHLEGIFFLSRFSFTDTVNLWDYLYSPVPLPPANKHPDISLQLCMWDNYLTLLIILHVTTRQLLHEIYLLWEFSFNWLMMECYLMTEVNFSLLDDLILDFITVI